MQTKKTKKTKKVSANDVAFDRMEKLCCEMQMELVRTHEQLERAWEERDQAWVNLEQARSDRDTWKLRYESHDRCIGVLFKALDAAQKLHPRKELT